MILVAGRNINTIYQEGLWKLRIMGKEERSRNGPVLVLPEPVTTIYDAPEERVLINPARRPNPFFHLFEAMWMLAGRNDLAFVEKFVKRFADYSDDGLTLRGAYGFRWRRHFAFDQVKRVVDMIKENPQTRRAVISMWDPVEDLGHPHKDIPCNTTIYFRVRETLLDMTVCCRSNDAIWGAYGANAVHFSFLLEYIACATGLNLGKMYQISNNFHVYTGMPRFHDIWNNYHAEDPYGWLTPCRPLFEDARQATEFLLQLEISLVNEFISRTDFSFIDKVLKPMWHIWHTRDERMLPDVEAEDWREAARLFLGGEFRFPDQG